MKNPNSNYNRIKKYFLNRWSACDTPAAEPRFYINYFIKDLVVFLLLPIGTALLFQILKSDFINKPTVKNKARNETSKAIVRDLTKSQIIEFSKHGIMQKGNFSRRSPGTIIKVKLLNAIETFGNAPVHAQVIDNSLGQEWIGSTLIGDATSDQTFDRINIAFRFIKSEFQPGHAKIIKARALNLNGTLGVEAEKKEGFFARSVFNSTGSVGETAKQDIDQIDVKHFLAKALANGLLQEFGSSSNNERAKSQVYILNPGEIFFIELTDFFPCENQ